MTIMTHAKQPAAEDLRSSAIVLRYAASLFLNAAHAANDPESMAAGESIIELLGRVVPEAHQSSPV